MQQGVQGTEGPKTKVSKCGKAEVLNRASFEKGETKGGGIERERGGKDL